MIRRGDQDHVHVFAVEWEPKLIRFYVDDQLYATRTPADLPQFCKALIAALRQGPQD